MKNKEKKKGIFASLFKKKKQKKGCDCCNLEIEEIQENVVESKNKDTKKSCCT